MARGNGSIDYAAALAECGFDSGAVGRGLQMLESDRYFGFADVVTSLTVFDGAATQRGYLVDGVVRRVQQQEAAATLLKRGDRASASVAAHRAEEAAQRHADDRRTAALLEESSRVANYLLENMTDDELDDRVPHRPHIAAAFRRLQEINALQHDGLTGGFEPTPPAGASSSTEDAELDRLASEAFGGDRGSDRQPINVEEVVRPTFSRVDGL